MNTDPTGTKTQYKNVSAYMSKVEKRFALSDPGFQSLFQRHENHQSTKMLKDQTLKLGDARLLSLHGVQDGGARGKF